MATASGSPGGRTTTPVSPSTTASAAPPLSPATWGTPAAAASRKTMPKPSCSSPPQRLRHTWRTRRRSRRAAGRSSSGTRPRKRTGHRCLGGQALEAALGRARRRRWRRRRSGRSAASRPAASISTSKPLRGTSRLTPTTSGTSAGRPKRGAGRVALGGVERAEPVDVDARAARPRWAGRGRRRARPRPPGSRRRRRRARRPAAPGRAAPGVPGRRPGTVTSAPCSTTP